MKKILKKKNNKIGILGGTFDPPHEGHLNISKIAIKKLKLDKIIWVITKQNPLKQKPYLSVSIRKKLSKNLTKYQKKISIKYLEDLLESKDTFSILKFFLKKKKKIKLFFLIGADNLINFHKWKKWKKIPKLAKIVIFPRENHLIKKNKYIASKSLKKSDLIYINSKKVNISSSLIRKFW